MTVSIGAAMRYCPACATLTVEPFCPADGVATFARKKVLPSAATMNVGDVVAGKYRVQRILGVGGFGAVYEAEHTGGLGRVALKMLSPTDHDEGDIRRFFREAQVTAGLRHPNTVRVFDVGQHDTGALYLAMELVHGHTLEEELRARKLLDEVMTEAETLEIGIDTLRSLSEAHSRGLVHRDLKPANLMLTDVDGERVVKVLDFGIALVKGSSLTGSGHALGTPAYMSPEQCGGEPVDGRSDLYSLGVVLYRCLTGQPPFHDANPLTTMMAHLSNPPPPLASLLKHPVSQGLIDVVEKAMAKAPADRFADARQMRAALETVQRALQDQADQPLHKGGWDFRYREDPSEGAIDRTRVGAAVPADFDVSVAADTESALPAAQAARDAAATKLALRREAVVQEGTGDYTRFVRRSPEDLLADAGAATSDLALPAPAARRMWPWLAVGVAALLAAVIWFALAHRAPSPVPVAAAARGHRGARVAPPIAPEPPPVAPPAPIPSAPTEVAAPLAPTPSEQARSQPVPTRDSAVEPVAHDMPAGKPKARKHGHSRGGGARGDDDLSLPE